MPQQMMGTSVCDYPGRPSELHARMSNSVRFCLVNHIAGLDTGRDYGNEALIGNIIHKLIVDGTITREEIFLTTKVGNSQQRLRNMQAEIDTSLRDLKLDYLDLWLLHWPLPDCWLDNWAQITEIYKTGKVKAVGIANLRERHIDIIKKAGLPLPHVVQIEHHPFRTVMPFLDICRDNCIQVEAYSSNCLMLPFVKDNTVLKEIAASHHKTVPQVMTRWHIQHGVIPIFSSFNPNHITENVNVYDFELNENEMELIFNLNQNYKFHPESVNCPGY